MRNHPGLNYYRSGVPIVISGDDPGSFGYNDLTLDYYMIFMAWDLDLFDLRAIANNSIKYSMLASNRLKNQGYLNFEHEWNDFIDLAYENALEINNNKNIKLNESFYINIQDVFPLKVNFNHRSNDYYLTIFGYGFNCALFKNLYCLFDQQVKTKAKITDLNRIKCPLPSRFLIKVNQTVQFSLLINDFVVNTDFKIKFI